MKTVHFSIGGFKSLCDILQIFCMNKNCHLALSRQHIYFPVFFIQVIYLRRYTLFLRCFYSLLADTHI